MEWAVVWGADRVAWRVSVSAWRVNVGVWVVAWVVSKEEEEEDTTTTRLAGSLGHTNLECCMHLCS